MSSSNDPRRFRLSDRLGDSGKVLFEGTLAKRFSPYFDYLLDSEHAPEESSDYHEIFVPDTKFAEKLHRRVTSAVGQITAITGARGIGKSTNIRHYFGITTDPKISRFRSCGDNQAEGPETLIIPFYLDSYNLKLSNVERVLTAQVQAAAELVMDERSVTVSDDELCNFIRSHKKQLITFPDLPLGINNERRISELRQRNLYGYVSELVKYSVFKGGIKRILLIVDDIESCDYRTQKALVKGVMKLRDCLKNTGRLASSYKSDYIFTCRPATFKVLRQDPEIDGFSIQHPIEINKPASLSEVVERRFEYAIKIIGEGRTTTGKLGAVGHVRNLDSWRQAFNVLEQTIERITSISSDFIVTICNNDLRRSMMELQEILRNSRWYDQGHLSGTFSVQEESFQISAAALVRAMVLKNNMFYSEELSTTVPNIFWNDAKADSDLILLHLVKLFFERSRSRKYVAIPLRQIKRAFKKFFGRDVIDHYFDDVVQYGIDTELFRKETVSQESKRRSEVFLIPMNKLFYIWKLCKENSIFLEFFRDNTYLEHHTIHKYPSARNRGTSLLNSEDKFCLACDFASEIASQERRILRRIQDTGIKDDYVKTFGSRLISKALLSGLRSSTRRHYASSKRPTTVSRSISQLADAVSHLEDEWV